MGSVTINGVRLNTQQITRRGASDSADMLLVHGLASNMGYWMRDYVDFLSQYFRITLVDMRGHGRSACPEAGYDPQQLGDDLRGVIDALDLTAPHIVAHSFGGIAALNLALDRPDKVASLVILDTMFGKARGNLNVLASESTFQTALRDEGMVVHPEHPFAGLLMLVELSKRKLDSSAAPVKDKQVKFLLDNLQPSAAKKWLHLVDQTDAVAQLCGVDHISQDRLAQMDIPLLAMYGGKSRALPSGQNLVTYAPRADLHVLPDAGHFFARTRASEVLSRCMAFWADEGVIAQSNDQTLVSKVI
jgi:pimeloyl-ACP methyl ester carboxylesterase